MHRARKLNQKSNAILPFCSLNFVLFFLRFVAPLIAKHIVKPALTIWAPEWCVHGRLNGSWIEYTKWILCGTKSQMHANARNLIKIRAGILFFIHSFIVAFKPMQLVYSIEKILESKRKTLLLAYTKEDLIHQKIERNRIMMKKNENKIKRRAYRKGNGFSRSIFNYCFEL